MLGRMRPGSIFPALPCMLLALGTPLACSHPECRSWLWLPHASRVDLDPQYCVLRRDVYVYGIDSERDKMVCSELEAAAHDRLQDQALVVLRVRCCVH